jgi:hypothetical protein
MGLISSQKLASTFRVTNFGHMGMDRHVHRPNKQTVVCMYSFLMDIEIRPS